MRSPVLASIVLAALLGACGIEPAPGPPIRGQEVLLGLLALERDVVRAPEDHAPVVDVMRPRLSGADAFGPRRALVLAPPTEVVFQVPPTEPRAVLRFALAVRRAGYRGRGTVDLRLELDGEPLFEQRLDASAATPLDERRWYEFELPLARGGELRIACSYEGNREPPQIGIARLRVGLPFEVERQRASPRAPNVVLVVIDTLRADRLHSYGNPLETSPVMDALAERGLRFERAFSSSPWTVTSTASILTGRSQPQHGLGLGESNYLADSVHTLAQVMRRAGLDTAAFVCNPLVGAQNNLDSGFETFRVYPWASGVDVSADLCAWLRAVSGTRFFLYLHYVEPHTPYTPSAESAERFRLPTSEVLVADVKRMMKEYYAKGAHDAQRLARDAGELMRRYDAEVFDADRELGRVLALLEELGQTDSTVVCVTSDHGEEFFEHGWLSHSCQLFDESVRVPLIFAGPGVPRGRAVPFAVENRHLAPTLLALAGVEPPAPMRGPNLTDSADLEQIAGRAVHVMNSRGSGST